MGMLASFRPMDPSIYDILDHRKFCVLYVMTPQSSPSWVDGNISGGVYLVKRNTEPIFQVILKNVSADGDDLVDGITPAWEIDTQDNYIFYRVNNTQEHIRGLWFKEDEDRVGFLNSVKAAHAELEEAMREPRPALHRMKAPPAGTSISISQPPAEPYRPPSEVRLSSEPRTSQQTLQPSSINSPDQNPSEVRELYSLFGIPERSGRRSPSVDDSVGNTKEVIEIHKSDIPRLVGISVQHLLQHMGESESAIDGIWSQALEEFGKSPGK